MVGFSRVLGALAVGWAVFSGQMAGAGTVSILAVDAGWATSNPTSIYGIGGLGSNQINWGRAATPRGQSAFRFDGLPTTVAPSFPVDEVFSLGTFTHFNRTIYATGPKTHGKDAFIHTAKLSLSITADFGEGVVLTRNTSFDFSLLETLNEAKTCANGAKNHKGVNINGCADRVRLLRDDALSETFIVGGLQYQFDIRGFGGTTEFWTAEDRANSIELTAIFKYIGPVPPEPSPVPLPAGGLLLLSALGLSLAVKRRVT